MVILTFLIACGFVILYAYMKGQYEQRRRINK